MKVIRIRTSERVKKVETEELEAGQYFIPNSLVDAYQRTDIELGEIGACVRVSSGRASFCGWSSPNTLCDHDGEPEYEDVLPDDVKEVRFDELKSGDVFGVDADDPLPWIKVDEALYVRPNLGGTFKSESSEYIMDMHDISDNTIVYRFTRATLHVGGVADCEAAL